MSNNILLKFAKKGINLSPDAYAKVMQSDNPTNFASELIVKLKSSDFKAVDLIAVDGETIDVITGNVASSEETTSEVQKKSEAEVKTDETIEPTPNKDEKEESQPKVKTDEATPNEDKKEE